MVLNSCQLFLLLTLVVWKSVEASVLCHGANYMRIGPGSQMMKGIQGKVVQVQSWPHGLVPPGELADKQQDA